MAAIPRDDTHRAAYEEAHTAWSVGTDVARWRASLALGALCAGEGAEGEAGPAVHLALMVARLLKARDIDPRRTSTWARRLKLEDAHVSSVAVLNMQVDQATVAFAVAGAVSIAVVYADVKKVSGTEEMVTVFLNDDASAAIIPIALLPTGPTSCLAVSTCGANFAVNIIGEPACARLRQVAPPAERVWWSAVSITPRELALFSDSDIVHTVSLQEVNAEMKTSTPTLSAVRLGLPSSTWQRGASCTEGLWAAADSRDACTFRFAIFDERQRSSRRQRSPRSSRSGDTSQSSGDSSTASILVTFVVTTTTIPSHYSLVDFAGDGQRCDMAVSVRFVSLVAPPVLDPRLPPVGTLLNGFAMMVRCGDGASATLTLASAVASELITLKIDLHAQEAASYSHQASEHVRIHDDSTTAEVVALPEDAVSALAVSWIGPHVRHPRWHADASWRRETTQFPLTGHVTVVSVGSGEVDILIHATAV